MIITDISEYKKNKYKVYVDYEFAFVLYKGELHKYHLQKDARIPEEIYEELMEQVLPKRAKLRAMNLLTKRPYTEKKLREKLEEGLYPQKCVESAITYVASFGYLDDRAYALDYITYHMSSQSRKVMKQKLIQKGIDEKIICECLEEVGGDEGAQAEIEQIRRLFLKKYKSQIPGEPTEKAKMMSYFMRKGYSASVVKSAFQEISLDDLYN